MFANFLVRSRLLFACFYGHYWELTTLWPQRLAMYKEKVCSVGMTLILFWMPQMNYPFNSDLETCDFNGLGGRFRSFEAVLSKIVNTATS